MFPSLPEMFAPWLLQLLTLCTLHSLPCVAYVALAPSTTLRAKLLSITAFAALLGTRRGVVGGSNADVLVLGLALGYFAGLTLAIRGLARARGVRRVPAPICLLVAVALFVVPPGCFAPQHLAVPSVVFGWELMFSGYSYFWSVSRGGTPGSIGEALFFMLVDPTLVYARRATRSATPAPAPRALTRMLLGVLALASALAIGVHPAVPTAMARFESTGGYVPFATAYGLYLVSIYLAPSGLAALQLGSLQLLGFRLDERFRYPLAAQSPVDFWRRWNIYLGDWLRVYVFVPAARCLRGALPSASTRTASGLALLATFVVCGLLHDLVALVFVRRLTLEASAFFIVQGVVTLAWLAASARSRVPRPLSRRLRSVVGCVVTLHLVAVSLLAGNAVRSVSVRLEQHAPPGSQ